MEWHVDVDARSADQIAEDTLFDIMDALASFSAATALDPGGYIVSVAMSINANSVAEAAEIASHAVNDTMNSLGHPVVLAGLDVKSDAQFTREQSEPRFPAVVGYAEIADMAGVSRQRARQFAESDSFPTPVITTAQGPLMSQNAVRAWLDDRNTKPGRPRKPATC